MRRKIMNSEIFSIREKLKASLKPGRYEHSLSVSFTCMALAMRYGYDLDKAELAGLLHDCAKCYDNNSIIAACRNSGMELTEGELQAPSILLIISSRAGIKSKICRPSAVWLLRIWIRHCFRLWRVLSAIWRNPELTQTLWLKMHIIIIRNKCADRRKSKKKESRETYEPIKRNGKAGCQSPGR